MAHPISFIIKLNIRWSLIKLKHIAEFKAIKLVSDM